MKAEEEDDEDWGVDINETAVAERMKEQTEAIQRLTMNDDLEKTANERMNLFYDFLKVKTNPFTLKAFPSFAAEHFFKINNF